MIKMKRIIVLLMLLLLPIASAIDVCEDKPKISTPCMMLTPEISECSIYDYKIYEINTTTESKGDLINNGTLSTFNGEIYYFNFTEAEGEYLVRLCDGAVREVIVENDNDEFWLYVVSGLVLLGLLGLGYYIEDNIFVIMSGMLSMVIALNLYHYGYPDLTSEFLRHSIIIIFAGIGFYFVLAPSIEKIQEWRTGLLKVE